MRIDRFFGKRLVQRRRSARAPTPGRGRTASPRPGGRRRPRPTAPGSMPRRRTGWAEWPGRTPAACAPPSACAGARRWRVLIVAGHVRQARGEPVVGVAVDAAVSLEALADARAPAARSSTAGAATAIDRHVSSPRRAIACRAGRSADSEIPGGAEQDERIGRAARPSAASAAALDVAAELVAHRRQQPVGEVVLAARAEAAEERGGQDRRRRRRCRWRRSPSIALHPNPTRARQTAAGPGARRARAPSGRAATTRPRCRAATVRPPRAAAMS